MSEYIPEKTEIVRYEEHAMAIPDVKRQINLIQEVMRDVMKDGEHYGKIPGCGDKPALLKAGAEKLILTFRLVNELDVEIVNHENHHREYRVITTIYTQNHKLLGTGVGSCSTMESKYRWRGGARKCPECSRETIIKGKKEYGGGWLCYKAKGGCGAKWPDGAEEIEKQSTERVENLDVADQYNTCLKMAKKRSLIDAVLTVTAASDIFTQDIDETVESLASHNLDPKKEVQESAVQDSDSPNAPVPEGHEKHWAANSETRKKFWAWAISDNGMTREQVHKILGVKSLYEYKGTYSNATSAIFNHIQEITQ